MNGKDKATVVVAPLRQRLSIYEEECRKKKEFEKREVISVARLEDTQKEYYRSPGKDTQRKSGVDASLIHKIDKSLLVEYESSHHSNASQLPGESTPPSRRGSLLLPRSPGGSPLGISPISPPQERRKSSMRPAPDLHQDRSFEDPSEKPKKVLEQEEKAAKESLSLLLDDNNGEDGERDSVPSTRVLPFSAVRARYVSAIKELRPVKPVGKLPVAVAATTDGEGKAILMQRRASIKAEASKEEKFVKIQTAWDAYEQRAQDRPELPSAADKEIQEVEDEIVEEWMDYASEVELDITGFDESSSAIDEDDEELLRWLAEAKQLKSDALARKQMKKQEAIQRARVHVEKMKIEEENRAKTSLYTLMADEKGGEEEKQSPQTIRTMGFRSVRERYVQAIKKLRPAEDVFEVRGDDKKAVREEKKAKVKQEVNKKEKFVEIREAWDTYEKQARDKPVQPSDEDHLVEEKLDHIEDEIVSEWVGYAEKVERELDYDDTSSSYEDEDELKMWLAEAKQLKADALRRKREKDLSKKESAAKHGLTVLLDEAGVDEATVSARPVTFRSVRDRYTRAVDKLRPSNLIFNKSGDDSEGAGSRVKNKIYVLKKEAEKEGKLREIRSAWDIYEEVAMDKPKEPSEEDKEAEKKTMEIEDAVVSDWADYAEKVENELGGDDESSSSYDDEDELKMWLAEAKQLKAEAVARRQAKEAAKLSHIESSSAENKHHDDDDDGGGIEESESADTDATEAKKESKQKASEGEEDESKKMKKNHGKSTVDLAEDASEHEKKKKKKGMKKGGSEEDEDEVTSISKKKKKERPRTESGALDDEDNDDEKGDEEDAGKKKKKKGKKGGVDEEGKESPVAPAPRRKSVGKTASKKTGDLKDVDLDANSAPPRNADGTLWKNPLKGWNNQPKKKAKIVGAQITLKIPGKTDCWRKTRHNFIVDTAPFHWHKVTGDFEVIVCVSGEMKTMYDKAGIMVRRDAENWILTGMEFFNDRINHSTSVTLDKTDWSLSPLPDNAEKVGIWFCLKRIGAAYETFYSVNGKKWIQTRQGSFTDQPTLYVGICGASPMGDEFKATFDFFRCRSI